MLGVPLSDLCGVAQGVVRGKILVVSGEAERESEPVPASSPRAVRSSSSFFLGPDWLAIAASMEGSGSVINVVL